MKSLAYFNIAAQQVTTHTCNAIKLEGFYRSATVDAWLQVHDSATTPANAAVPLKEWPIYQTTEFFKDFKLANLPLTKGLYIAVSSTEGTYTLSAEVMDLQVELDGPEEPSSTTVVGDLVSSITHLDVWAEGSGPHKLIRLEVKSTSSASPAYIMLFGRVFANVSNGDRPIWQQKILAATAQFTVANGNPIYFGLSGFPISQQIAGVNYVGLSVIISDTPTILTTTGEDFTIKAEYK